MADPITIAAVVTAGVVGYEVYDHRGQLLNAISPGLGGVTPPNVPTTNQPLGANAPKSNSASVAMAGGVYVAGTKATATHAPGLPHLGAVSPGASTQSIDNSVNQEIDYLTKQAKDAFDAMACDEKINAMNQLKAKYPTIALDPNKGCNQTYEQIAEATGTVIGTAACVTLGLGATIAPVCGVIGAIFAGKVEQWIENYAQADLNALEKLPGDAKQVGSAIVDEAQSIYDTVVSWF